MGVSILEYNEKENNVHMNVGRNVENTNGYKTVTGMTDDRILMPFCRYMDFKYPRGTTFVNYKKEYECYEFLLKCLKEYNF